MAKVYWVRVSGRTRGPFSAKQIKQLAATGRLQPQHEISADEKKWTTAGQVNGLQLSASNSTGGSKTERICKNDGSTKPTKLKDDVPQVIPSGSAAHYWEVQTPSGTKTFKSIETLRAEMVNGSITRHNLAREVAPKPEYPINDDSDRKFLQELVGEWEAKRKWRVIGDGIAKEEAAIQGLYHPMATFATAYRDTSWFVFGIVIYLFVLAFLWFWNPDVDPTQAKDANAPGIGDFFLVLLVRAMPPFAVKLFIKCIWGFFALIPVFFVAMVLSWLIGIPIGFLVFKTRENSLVLAPDDNFEDEQDTSMGQVWADIIRSDFQNILKGWSSGDSSNLESDDSQNHDVHKAVEPPKIPESSQFADNEILRTVQKPNTYETVFPSLLLLAVLALPLNPLFAVWGTTFLNKRPQAFPQRTTAYIATVLHWCVTLLFLTFFAWLLWQSI